MTHVSLLCFYAYRLYLTSDMDKSSLRHTWSGTSIVKGRSYMLHLHESLLWRTVAFVDVLHIYSRKLLHMFRGYILAIFWELQGLLPCKQYVAARHIHICTNVTIRGWLSSLYASWEHK